MTAFTTQRAGNWSDTTTSSPWYVSGGTPCAIPGNGDTATFAHVVTADVDTTVGTSPAPAATVVTFNSGGHITVAAGKTLTVRGNVVKAASWAGGATTSVAITASASPQSILVNSSASLKVGGVAVIHDGDAPEAVLVTAIADGTHFTAVFTKNHASGKIASLCVIGLLAGAKFQFDSTQASPTSTVYSYAPNANSLAGVDIACVGTSGSHCTVTSVTTGGAAHGNFPSGGFSPSAQVMGNYADIQYIGDASNNAFTYNMANINHCFALVNCTFDNCGEVLGNSAGTGCIHVMQSVRFTNSLQSTISYRTTAPFAAAFTGNSFDKQVQFYSALGMTITGNVFLAGHDATAGLPTLYEGNFVYATQDTINWYGDISHSYLVMSTAGNPHGYAMKSTANDQTFDGILIESVYAAGNGQGDFLFPSGNTHTWTFQNCILLPQTNNASPGKLVSCLGIGAGYTGTIVCNHNTVCTTAAATNIETGALNYGEGVGTAGMVSQLKSNLCWTPAGQPGGAVLYKYSGAVQDAVSGANADYNGKSGLASTGVGSGTSGVGYLSADSTAPCTTSCGAHDVSAAPNFVDATRNFATWAQRLHGADGTVAGALAYIAAHPETIYSASDMTTLWQYVRAGFAPTNPAYKGTAHDGTDIGAVPVVLLGSPMYAYVQQ